MNRQGHRLMQRIAKNTYMSSSGVGKREATAISGSTVDSTGAISKLHITICWTAQPVAANYLTGASLEVNGGGGYTLSAPVWVGDCLTYSVSPDIPADAALVWKLDNSGGTWTDPDSGDPISDQSVNVRNLWVTPVALSATVAADGKSVAVRFNVPVYDTGAGPPYTGDAQIRKCNGLVDLTITQSTGDGTAMLTYQISETIEMTDTVEWTASGIPFSGGCT